MRWNHDVVSEIRSDALEGDSVRNPAAGVSNLPSMRQFNGISLQSTPIGERENDELADEPIYVRDEYSQD
jgi:hypothetical protein